MFSGRAKINGVDCDVTFRPTNFGQRLRSLRMLKGWTVSEFARRVCVAPVTICYWESGYTNPSKISLECICNLFGIDTAVLIPDESKDEKRAAIHAFIHSANLTVDKLALKLGIPTSTLTYAINTRRMPRYQYHRDLLKGFFGEKFEELFDIETEV